MAVVKTGRWCHRQGHRVPEPKDARGLSLVLATTDRVGSGLFSFEKRASSLSQSETGQRGNARCLTGPQPTRTARDKLPAICVTSITFSSLAKAAAPEITKDVPVDVLSWIFRLKTVSGELNKHVGHVQDVQRN